MLRSTLALALLASAVPASAQEAPQTAAPAAEAAPAYPDLPLEQAAMRAHVMFLADDTMQGREAGTEEYDIAANYVAARFYANGLRPAGDNGGFLQRVPLMNYKPAEHGSFVFTRRGAEPVTLSFGEDFVPAGDPTSETTTVDAPLVFVGWGIHAPSEGRDDYRGVDVRGKIVVFLNGVPEELHSEIRASLGSANAKADMAGRLGAVGAIAINNPGPRSLPFAAQAANWQRSRTTWVNPDGSGHVDTPQTPVLGTLSREGAAKLFQGARMPWEQVQAAAADSNARLRAMNLPGRLAVTLKTERELFESANVAGLLPGSDPAVADEVVVLTAHLDHVGVGRPVEGDSIYNGAMDNAVGIASLIEEASRFQKSGERPRRSILFLAVTAEEKGLVGADYFAENPSLPGKTLVANVNLDMPILTYRFEDVIAFGADRSTLGPIVRRAAQNIGVGFSPDPMPEQSLFVRSDHYRFVQQGIPSVFLWPGHAGPGAEGTNHFFQHHYHRPSDQLDQAPVIDWEAGVRFIEVNYQIAREIADADARPVWNAGDFFGTLYEGPMAR
ncbi:M28 family metallopeptidase [Sphingosinithalassobacter sp. LHW66-3]|uniref:M28 family metallopeptidase n=1 Tax=Sphingosinithalassobacter sp. LHW66-3 TaxID=3424718 RepID=UPI003D6C0BDE